MRVSTGVGKGEPDPSNRRSQLIRVANLSDRLGPTAGQESFVGDRRDQIGMVFEGPGEKPGGRREGRRRGSEIGGIGLDDPKRSGPQIQVAKQVGRVHLQAGGRGRGGRSPTTRPKDHDSTGG